MAVKDGFELVIQVNSKDWTLYLDTCMEKRINTSATIPTQPLQNGDTVSDHMYRNPDEFSINGTFSEFGNNENDSTYNDIVSEDCDRITAIQTVFERIKDEGLLCDLTTIERGANGNYRFKIRKNMALQSITWTELQVSLKYSFVFKEIMTVNIQEYKAQIDSDLPNIYLPETKSLGMLMTEEAKDGEVSPIVAMVMKALLETGRITKSDAEYIISAGGGLNKWQSTDAHTSPLGKLIPAPLLWIFSPGYFDGYKFGEVVADVFTMGIYSFFKNLGKGNDFNAANATYKLVNNLKSHINKNGALDIKGAMEDPTVSFNEDELRRLVNFLNSIKNLVNSISTNVAIYDLSKSIDDNSDREVVLNIANNPYYISFTRMNGEYPNWNIQIRGLSTDGTPIDLNGSNGIRVTQNKLCTMLEDMCDKNNALFWDSTLNYQVYLYKSGNQSITTTSFSGKKTSILAPERFLCNLNLLVVKGNFRDEMQKIYDRIYSELVNAGYN